MGCFTETLEQTLREFSNYLKSNTDLKDIFHYHLAKGSTILHTTWKWNLKWINNKSYACLSQDLLKKVTLKVCKFYSNKSCIQARDVFSTHKLHTHTIEKEWICNCVGALKKNKNPHLRWKWNAQFRMMVNFCHEFCVHTTTMI